MADISISSSGLYASGAAESRARRTCDALVDAGWVGTGVAVELDGVRVVRLEGKALKNALDLGPSFILSPFPVRGSVDIGSYDQYLEEGGGCDALVEVISDAGS